LYSFISQEQQPIGNFLLFLILWIYLNQITLDVKRADTMAEELKIQNLTTEKTEFKREVGVFGGVSLLGGIMIGSGIFYIGSYVMMRTGMSQGLSLLAWIIGGIVCLLGGLCLAELGTAMPKAGGMTVYLNEAYHPIVGFLCGFSSWLLGGPGSIAGIAIALPTAMRTFFDLSDFSIKMIAVILILGLTVYNYLGIKQGSVLQNITMVAKLVPIVIILVAALFLGRATPDLSLVPQGDSVSSGKVIGMVAFAVIATLWAYEGWTNLNTISEEVKNPRRNLPLSIIIAIVSITVLYTLFNFAIYRVFSLEEIKTYIDSGNFYLGTEVAKLFMGNFGAILVTVGMIVSMFGALNGCILAFPRMYYAMSVEGHFFKSFKVLHPVNKIPTAALFVQAGISIILVVFRSLDQLTSLVIFSGMIYNFLTVLAVIILRRKYPTIERPYKAWGYPVLTVITALIFMGLMVNTFIEDPTTALLSLAVQVAGVLVYLIFDRIYQRERAN